MVPGEKKSLLWFLFWFFTAMRIHDYPKKMIDTFHQLYDLIEKKNIFIHIRLILLVYFLSSTSTIISFHCNFLKGPFSVILLVILTEMQWVRQVQQWIRSSIIKGKDTDAPREQLGQSIWLLNRERKSRAQVIWFSIWYCLEHKKIVKIFLTFSHLSPKDR